MITKMTKNSKDMIIIKNLENLQKYKILTEFMKLTKSKKSEVNKILRNLKNIQKFELFEKFIDKRIFGRN